MRACRLSRPPGLEPLQPSRQLLQLLGLAVRGGDVVEGHHGAADAWVRQQRVQRVLQQLHQAAVAVGAAMLHTMRRWSIPRAHVEAFLAQVPDHSVAERERLVTQRQRLEAELVQARSGRSL